MFSVCFVLLLLLPPLVGVLSPIHRAQLAPIPPDRDRHASTRNRSPRPSPPR